MEKSERQGKVGKSSEAKRCSVCGARTWLKDAASCQWSGPWHFIDCPEIPGGAELMAANIEERMRYAEEKTIPRAQGARILQAIMAMMEAASHDAMIQRKVAIQEEIANL